MEGDKREMRKRRDTSRSAERKPEESKEKEEGNQVEGKIEKRFNEHDERIQKNTDTFQQFIEMMQRDKRERAEKEAKEKEEKEQRRRQKEEKEQREKQERNEKEQRDKQDKVERRREKEQEKLIEKQEIMQKFESLEKRILDSEENFHKIIESTIKRNTEQMKEQIENKLVESKKEMEIRMDIQDIHLKEIKEKINQDNLEVEKSIGTIEGKLKEVKTEQISQQQKLDRVQQEMGNIRQSTGIENIRVTRPEIITQPPIYYGDNRTHPQKYITNVRVYLEEIVNINGDENRNKIMTIIRDTLKNDAEVWFNIIEEQCSNFGEFERLFLKQFWGAQRQSKVRNSLIMGKYNKSIGRSNREKYALQKYSQAMYLEPRMAENEIISLIANHFDEEVNMQIAIQDMRNLQVFLEYLRRIDQAEMQRAGTIQVNHVEMRRSPEREIEQRGYRRDQNREEHYRPRNRPTFQARRGTFGRFNPGRNNFHRYPRESMNRGENQERVNEGEESQQRERRGEQEM